jgi:hypothetical protein
MGPAGLAGPRPPPPRPPPAVPRGGGAAVMVEPWARLVWPGQAAARRAPPARKHRASLTPVCTTAALSNSHVSRLGMRQLETTQGLISTKWHSPTPRDNASMPTAPVPANRSSHLRHTPNTSRVLARLQQKVRLAVASHPRPPCGRRVKSGAAQPAACFGFGAAPRRLTACCPAAPLCSHTTT